MGNDAPVFWKRDDVYRHEGECAYAGLCKEYKDGCDPEKCDTWEAFYDGESQADEILSE
jgi:hypothetical protein